MIVFNELKISPDNTEMVINVSVPNIDIYKDVYIDSIIIDNQDTFTNNGPSSKPVYSMEVEGNKKNIRLSLCVSDINLADNLFFVYVNTKGNPSPDTPCTMDNSLSLAIIFNKYPIFRVFMNYVKEVEADCAIPKKFIDNILRFKALCLCINTGNYVQAIKYWNRFFKDSSNQLVNINTCGYGKSG